MSKVFRRTKIIATLGPASESPEVLEKLIRAGADVVRLNFSHGTADEHRARAERVRDISRKLNRHVAILADLQGPKIRVEKFKDDRKIHLQVGQKFDALVTGFDRSKKPNFSIKALQIAEEKQAVAQYGSSDSGASLGDILGEALKAKNEG